MGVVYIILECSIRRGAVVRGEICQCHCHCHAWSSLSVSVIYTLKIFAVSNKIRASNPIELFYTVRPNKKETRFISKISSLPRKI